MIRNPNAECRMPKEARNPNAETQVQQICRSSFGFRALGFLRISDFGFRISSSWLDRKALLLLRFFGLVFPFLDAALHAAEREQLFLVVNHFLSRQARERVILLEKDCLFRANLLAIA